MSNGLMSYAAERLDNELGVCNREKCADVLVFILYCFLLPGPSYFAVSCSFVKVELIQGKSVVEDALIPICSQSLVADDK